MKRQQLMKTILSNLAILAASRATSTRAAESSSKPRGIAQGLQGLTRLCALLIVAASGAASAATDLVTGEPTSINGRRELFLDNLLVDRLEGGAQRVFHEPVPREVVMTFDQPWEGNTCSAVAVFQVGDVYRLYYQASNTPGSAGGEKRGAHTFDAYAESRDGRHWTRPALGLVEFQGSKDNNLILKPAAPEGWALDALTPFRDENPEAAADALYIELYGDTVARIALWKDNPDLGALAGKPVRLSFVMRDADLYSIKFEGAE